MVSNNLQVDVLVVGGGIAGMQSALDLADQGYQVALVEKNPSVGGKMIGLSKVFPTLDCASCITTPKMSSVAHHDNIHLLTYTEVQSMTREGEGFVAQVLKKPRYVIEDDCTGCRSCELACPLDLPDVENEFGRTAHRVAYIPFPTAVPQKALIDIDHCVFCGKCIQACPANCHRLYPAAAEYRDPRCRPLSWPPATRPRRVGAKKEYGSGKLRNVIDGRMMERLLAPTGPYGRVLRPSDGKQPASIAYVQCAGSRDLTLGVPYCSRVCCMYAIKQAMLLSGTLPMADITIYYMDIRTFGKGYEQFYQNAKAMGIEFVKGKVARVTEDDDQNPAVRVELIEENRVVERKHDLVVLSTGMLPGVNTELSFGVPVSQDGFVSIPRYHIAPTVTTREGVFATGTATGPMDIVDSIVTSGRSRCRGRRLPAST